MGNLINVFELAAQIHAAKAKADMLDKLGEVTTETTASDKVGFLWTIYKVNDVVVRKEYIADPDAQGTSADTAIDLEMGAVIKPNTYYRYDGKVYVYMGEEAIFGGIDDMFAEWE